MWFTFSNAQPYKPGKYLCKTDHLFDDKKVSIVTNTEFRFCTTTGVMYPVWLSQWDGWKRDFREGLMWANNLLNLKDNEIYLEGIELKSCPFCGKQPKLENESRWIGCTAHDSHNFSLRCCLIDTGFRPFDKLIEKWNQRI